MHSTLSTCLQFYHDRDLTEDDDVKKKQINHIIELHRIHKLRDMQKCNTQKKSIFGRKTAQRKDTKQELLFAALGGVALGGSSSSNGNHSRAEREDEKGASHEERIRFTVEGTVVEEPEPDDQDLERESSM